MADYPILFSCSDFGLSSNDCILGDRCGWCEETGECVLVKCGPNPTDYSINVTSKYCNSGNLIVSNILINDSCSDWKAFIFVPLAIVGLLCGSVGVYWFLKIFDKINYRVSMVISIIIGLGLGLFTPLSYLMAPLFLIIAVSIDIFILLLGIIGCLVVRKREKSNKKGLLLEEHPEL